MITLHIGSNDILLHFRNHIERVTRNVRLFRELFVFRADARMVATCDLVLRVTDFLAYAQPANEHQGQMVEFAYQQLRLIYNAIAELLSIYLSEFDRRVARRERRAARRRAGMRRDGQIPRVRRRS